ncbi:MAG: TonB-dependent receptor [Flavobacteriaceae bacterium]
MKTKQLGQSVLILMLFLGGYTLSAQNIKGKVVDQNGNSIPYATVIQKGSSNGTTTDDDGLFELTIEKLNTTLIASSMGFVPTEFILTGTEYVTITMKEESVGLDEIVLTGNRAKSRTILNSAVPIDNFSTEELTRSGKQDIQRMLTFTVPSFNSQNQAISDATAHYDPADLRGLGPSRTLVLINGKRKNQSAQVYLNRTPGKGEVGVDLKAIPTAAIERVEILRDGASAQYGSDAIAGVINMVLKKDYAFSTFNVRSGVTSEGDGFNFATDFNTSLAVGNGGHLNLTLGYMSQRETNRAGTPGTADLPSDARPNEIEWAENNPDLGMHVGLPNLQKGDLFLTFSYPLSETAEFYSFNGYTTRYGQSYAYYRAPYWRRDVADAGFITKPEDFYGYQPTFETRINDYFNTVGTNWVMGDAWKADLSFTFGRNDVNYFVNNSVNRDYLADHGTSPRSFAPGGYALYNYVTNFDIGKEFNEVISLSAGLEYKVETFEAMEGDPLSYYGAGSDSFAGIKPEEVVDASRNNFGVYAGLDFDLTENLLLGVAGRYEDYSDAGDNFSYKVMGRYSLNGKGAIRASYSTGFRAPTLHQRYLTNSQYIIVAGSSEPLLQGTLANDNPAIQALGVPSLTHETSKNISAGLTYKFNNKFTASADFYQIKIDNRVLFSSQIGYINGSPGNPTNQVEQILDQYGVTAVQFFINAGNTTTTGGDIVLNYKNIEWGAGRFNAGLALNLNETTFDSTDTPPIMEQEGYNIFDRQEQGLITNSRPQSKYILNLGYDMRKWNFGLINTRWGQVTITAPQSGGTDQPLAAKITTDTNITYKFTDQMTLSFMAGNIFDVYQDVTLTSTNTAQAGSRFVYSSEVQQMGQLGANFNLAFRYSF